MIDQIIRWSLHNRLLVLAASMGLLLWGGWATVKTPIDVFPDLTAPSVTIVAEAHGMPPEDVEALVTIPIESAMNGASGVRRVRSTTGVGNSVVTVEFEWGTDIYLARQIVSEKLQGAMSSLPPDLPPPQLAPVSSVMGEILFVALHSSAHDEMALKTTADWTVRRRLLAVPGVAEVIPFGGETRQFEIIANPERLAAYQVTLVELAEAARRASRNAAAGFITRNDQEFLIQGLGRAGDLEALGVSVVARRDGMPVLIRDLAEVTVGASRRRGTAAYNGDAAVIIGVQKQPDANTLALTEKLDVVLADLQASLPEGMVLESRVFRQADFINTAVSNLSQALRDGAILVVIIMFAFLLSGRATAIALLAIPLSLLVAILVIRWMGGTINTMTLGGMAIALGALVDDAIIVVENIIRRLRENRGVGSGREKTLEVIFNATREIEGSIVFATLIILLVFLPIFFLDGVEGRLLAPLGLAYVVALGASLLVALTITPVLCLFWLPGSKAVDSRHDTRFISWLKNQYRGWLDKAFGKPRLILVGSAILLIVSLGSLAFAGRAFLPSFNEGSLTVSAVTLPGTSLDMSDQIGSRVEKILLAQPEVRSTARRTGRAELDPHAQQVFASEIEASLVMGERSKEALLEALRHDFSTIPGVNIVIGQPISHRIDHMLSGTRANIAIKLFGEDLYELRRLGKQTEALVKQVPGAVDVAMDQQSEIPFVTVRFDRAAMANYGVTAAQAAELLEGAFTGITVGQLREGLASFDLVIRYPKSAGETIESLRQTLVGLPDGSVVPFEALADIRRSRGANTISRENVQRNLVVMANVAERDLISVVEDIQGVLDDQLVLPTGYHVEFGGQFESAQAANTRLILLGVVVIVGIFLLLMTAFGSARDAGLVMINLPLALIGGVAGVWLTEGIVNIAVIIGFITLFGIATRNGVILIDHIRRLMTEHNLDPENAIRRGAEERLVPILMTALATALALVPLAMAGGEPGSEIQAPMAVVILWGLISSTALNMVVVPVAYRWLVTKTRS